MDSIPCRVSDGLMIVYGCTKFHENILESIKFTQDFHKKIKRGIIPQKMYVDVQFLFFAHRLMMVYGCAKF